MCRGLPGATNKGIGIALVIALTTLAPRVADAKSPGSARVSVEALLARHGLARLAPEHRQLLFVTARGWSSSDARLQRFVRRGHAWKPVGPPMRARLGGKGLAWGRGLQPSRSRAHTKSKREGDHRSPAGVFALGRAFGTLRLAVSQRGRWPWRHVDRHDRWVDDPRSPLYNSWQRLDPARPQRWRSAEQLAAYRLAIVIAHNLSPVEKGAGSAIFLHSGDLAQPSVGCTVVELGALRELLRWLRPRAKPVLVQLPLRP